MGSSLASRVRKLTQAELTAEARERFGDDPRTYAFQCPHCDDIATIQEFIDAGDGARSGQECIGRLLGALKKDAQPYKGRGCDWAAYGLFHGPWEIVMPAEDGKPERSAWSFPLAPAPSTLILAKGDKLTWSGVAVVVTRVAKDGAWADLKCDDGEQQWTKRQPLPLPNGSKRIEEPIPGCTCEDCDELVTSDG